MSNPENAGGSGIEVVVGGPRTLSGEFGAESAPGEASKPAVKETNVSGSTMDFNADGSVSATAAPEEAPAEAPVEPTAEKPKPAEEAPEAAAEEAPKEGEEETPAEEEAAAEEAPEALPAWDPDNEEVAKAWDDKFFPGAGDTLATEGFEAELQANMAKEGGKPELNPESYAYLKDRLGVSKEYVDQIVAGQLALRQTNETNFYKLAAGVEGDAPFDAAAAKASYDAKVAWGSENYSAAQKERFNAAMRSGDPELIREQVELLDVRMAKAGKASGTPEVATAEPTAQPEVMGAPIRRGPPSRRPSSPAKVAAASPADGGTESGDIFPNNEEYLKAVKEAAGDPQKQAAVRAKLKRSTYWRP